MPHRQFQNLCQVAAVQLLKSKSMLSKLARLSWVRSSAAPLRQLCIEETRFASLVRRVSVLMPLTPPWLVIDPQDGSRDPATVLQETPAGRFELVALTLPVVGAVLGRMKA